MFHNNDWGKIEARIGPLLADVSLHGKHDSHRDVMVYSVQTNLDIHNDGIDCTGDLADPVFVRRKLLSSRHA